jgi:hypothetical protein
MAAFGQAAIGNLLSPNIGVISQYMNLSQHDNCPKIT